MKKRNYNHRRIKIHRCYTVEELAVLLSTHKNTVRIWIKNGLPTIDHRRPMLIKGHDLAAFLQDRRVKNKKKCNPGEMYCVKCHATHVPASNMVEYQSVNEKMGNLVAICPCCHSIMNRRVSLANLGYIMEKMNVTLPEVLRHITDRTKPTINSDLKKAIKPC